MTEEFVGVAMPGYRNCRERQQKPQAWRGEGNSRQGSPVPVLRASGRKRSPKESPVNSNYSCKLLPEEDSHVGREVPVVMMETPAASTTPPSEDKAAPKGDVSYEIFRHQYIKNDPNIVHRSYQLPRRLCAAFTQPIFINDLQQSYLVLVLLEAAEKKMRFIGERENVAACLHYVRTLAELWREPRTQCKTQ